MNIVLIIIVILFISFFWAYLSLRKELNRAKKKEYYVKPGIKNDQNDEIVLFDRTKRE